MKMKKIRSPIDHLFIVYIKEIRLATLIGRVYGSFIILEVPSPVPDFSKQSVCYTVNNVRKLN